MGSRRSEVEASSSSGTHLNSNGVSMFIAHRETEDGWVAIYGYGPYLLDGVSFSYGYDFQTEVVKEDQAVSLSQTSIPVAKLLGHHEGGRYKLVGEGDWGFILESDSMTYFQDGKILRSYRRVRE